MKRIHCIIVVLTFSFQISTLSGQEDDPIFQYWMYCDDKTFAYLELLYTDSTFHMHYQNGSNNYDSQGKFSLSNNIFFIKNSKKTEKYLLRNGKLLPAGNNGEYMDTEALTETKYTNIKDAFKECGIIRLQRRKAAQKKKE